MYKNLVCKSVRSYENKPFIFKDFNEENDSKFEKQIIDNDDKQADIIS